MFTRDDPWVNLLRGTIATFGAAVGGADSITVLPHDTVLGPAHPVLPPDGAQHPDAARRRVQRRTGHRPGRWLLVRRDADRPVGGAGGLGSRRSSAPVAWPCTRSPRAGWTDWIGDTVAARASADQHPQAADHRGVDVPRRVEQPARAGRVHVHRLWSSAPGAASRLELFEKLRDRAWPWSTPAVVVRPPGRPARLRRRASLRVQPARRRRQSGRQPTRSRRVAVLAGPHGDYAGRGSPPRSLTCAQRRSRACWSPGRASEFR